jgi:protein ImuB
MSRILCLWFPDQLPEDEQVLGRLAGWLERFAPLVGWQTISVSIPPFSSSRSVHASPSAAPAATRSSKTAATFPRNSTGNSPENSTGFFAPGDCLFGDVTKVCSLWGGEEQLLVAAHAVFRERGYRPRLALADTVGAAWGAAHFGEHLIGCSASSEMEAPIWRIPPGSSVQPWQDVPLEALRLSPACLRIFQQLGIERLGPFFQIPRQELIHRLGPEPVIRWEQWEGSVAERIVAYRATPEFVARHWFEHPLTRWEHLQSPIQQLMQKLVDQLAPHRRGVLRLECRLEGGATETLRLVIGFFRPTLRVGHWFELLELQLEQQSLPHAIQHLSLEVLQSAPLSARQPVLFAELEGSSSRQGRRQFEHLVDRLSSRLGETAVVCPWLRRDPQPERAFTVHPWLEVPSSRKSGSSRSLSPRGLGPFHRPLLLYDPPLPVEVRDVAGSGPPNRFSRKGREYQVVAYSGPERIETGWWRGPRIRRDYFRVETMEHQRFWLFHAVQENRWFLQGEFA